MDSTSNNASRNQSQRKSNQNIQVYVRVRPLNARERCIRSAEVVDVVAPREIVTRHTLDSKLTKKFTFDRSFGQESRQCEVYSTVVAPLIEEVLAGYNCTVFAYGQTGTGKTHTMVGNECVELKSSWEDDSEIGIIPRALSHLFDELRMMEVEYTMRISYLELYNEELCDLLSTDDTTKIRIFDDSTKKGSVIIQGLEEIPVHSKDDVYKLLEKGKERRKTATTLMNAQSSRSHTVFSIVVHIRENGIEGEDMLKIGKLNLVDLAGSENVSKAGNEKGIRVRETVNINQSLLTLGRVITALVDRAPHVPYRESKLTRLLQESLGGRTKTSIIATISPGHKDIEETLSTLEYAHRAKNIQNKPEVNQKLTKKTVLKEYTEEIDKLKRDLMAARDKNGIYLAEETYCEMTLKMESQNRELNEKVLLIKALRDELQNKANIFNEISLNLVKKTEDLQRTEKNLSQTKGSLQLTKKVLNKTKRRYKEKKVLVASHMKTETELSTQASQILEAADMAANDTQQLHNTIERRQLVDENIRSACDQFTERMLDKFDVLDCELIKYQEQQADSTKMLGDELDACTIVHKRLLADATQNIENIRSICNTAFEATGQQHDEFVSLIASQGDAHCQAIVAQILEHLKAREERLQQTILDHLHELTSNSKQQRVAVENMRDSFTKVIERSANSLDEHIQRMQQQLAQLATMGAQDARELQQMQAEVANEQALAQQEQSIVEDFMRQMDQIKELRHKNTTSLGKRIEQLESSNAAASAQTQQNIATICAFAKSEVELNQQATAEFSQHAASVQLCVDEAESHRGALHEQVDQLIKDGTEQAEQSKSLAKAHSLSIHENCAASSEQAKRLRLDQQQQLQLASEQLQRPITEDIQAVRSQTAMAAEIVSALRKQSVNYASIQKEQTLDCRKELLNFQQSELKTYAPTGTTPSKRNFIYPRTLAATSPHQEIVRRFRQEQDWSDLDTTATIDECSEGEDEALHSVQELSETETIMNSTPIEVPDGVNMKRGSSSSRSSNTLKQPRAQQRSSSLSGSLTPYKQSPVNSPARARGNKENVA
ncbi:kinesin-like protein Klp61F [Scaptodrosophila lebanonensis]|uniref:Kinesin-like protein Klp61F n=1 Tax=Drosophila lebanonensis TaxID=7225 RepID=A0A6J2TJL6_DROLE|nr:kinesin-like protein Klp61F [Scaptodrosophila lebanonensis]